MEGLRKTGVLVVDGCPIFLQGLADLINRQEDMACCGQASEIADLYQAVPSRKPDLVLLDLCRREADGFETIKGIRSRFPELRLLVVSALDETVYAERTLRAGALGYVMKEQSPEEILRAMRTVMQGEVYVSPRVTRILVQRRFS
jgi:DNA-binding NarL/FixJ family response regulator